VIFGVLAVFLVLIALAWLLVKRWLDEDGFPVRASLEEDGSIPPPAPQRGHHAAANRGLGQAKDGNAARTWDPEL
jgi:hypothetical protein